MQTEDEARAKCIPRPGRPNDAFRRNPHGRLIKHAIASANTERAFRPMHDYRTMNPLLQHNMCLVFQLNPRFASLFIYKSRQLIFIQKQIIHMRQTGLYDRGQFAGFIADEISHRHQSQCPRLFQQARGWRSTVSIQPIQPRQEAQVTEIKNSGTCLVQRKMTSVQQCVRAVVMEKCTPPRAGNGHDIRVGRR